MIAENQERFVQMLNEPIEGEGGQQAPGGVGAGGQGQGGGPGQLPPGTAVLQVTQAEREAIERVSGTFQPSFEQHAYLGSF